MADFNDIRKLATEKAGEIAEKTKVVAKTAVDMTRTTAKTIRLKAEIAGERDAIKKNFAVLGEMFYNDSADNPPEGYEQIFAEITVSYGIIQSKEDEIEQLSNSDESGKEIIENVKDKVGEAYVTVKDKVADVYEDIKDKVTGDGIETLKEVKDDESEETSDEEDTETADETDTEPEAEEEKKEPEAIETESENTNDSVHQEA